MSPDTAELMKARTDMGYPYEGYYPTMRMCEGGAEGLRAMYHTLRDEAEERLRVEKAREARRAPISLTVTIPTSDGPEADRDTVNALYEAFSQALEEAGVGSTALTEAEELDCAGHALMRAIDEYTQGDTDYFVRDLMSLLEDGSVSAVEKRRIAIAEARAELRRARVLQEHDGNTEALDKARAHAHEVADRLRDEALAEMFREAEDEG